MSAMNAHSLRDIETEKYLAQVYCYVGCLTFGQFSRYDAGDVQFGRFGFGGAWADVNGSQNGWGGHLAS